MPACWVGGEFDRSPVLGDDLVAETLELVEAHRAHDDLGDGTVLMDLQNGNKKIFK